MWPPPGVPARLLPAASSPAGAAVVVGVQERSLAAQGGRKSLNYATSGRPRGCIPALTECHEMNAVTEPELAVPRGTRRRPAAGALGHPADRATPSTSATTSGRCASGSTSRGTTSRSSSSPTCTRSPSSRTRRCCASARCAPPPSCSRWASTPTRSAIFVQSQIPAHAQLSWVLQCLTGFGEARRMTQFKDKSAKGGEGAASVGLFTYPILQAADILLYRPALRAGRRGPAPAPRAHPRPRPAVQPPLQEDLPAARALHPQVHRPRSPTSRTPRRRCRSRRPRRRGIIELLDDPKVSAKKIRSAVTDSGSEVRFDRGEAGHQQPAHDLLLPDRPRASRTSRRSTPAAATATSRRTSPTWSSSS